MSKNESCRSCKFFNRQLDLYNNVIDECRRNPPMTDTLDMGIRAVFAATVEDQWCGEYAKVE